MWGLVFHLVEGILYTSVAKIAKGSMLPPTLGNVEENLGLEVVGDVGVLG